MRRRTVLTTAAACLTAAGLPHPLRAQADPDAAQTLLEALRLARRARDLPEVTLAPRLAEMARDHALWMEAARHVTHGDAAGADPAARAVRAGYRGQVVGEILTRAHEDAERTFALWMEHGATRDMLLNVTARDIGLCGLCGSTGERWWSVVLGASRA